MTTVLIASTDIKWKGKQPKVDDARIFTPRYVVTEEVTTSVEFLKSKFTDLPAFGIWQDRTESDEELLEELGSGWRGFTAV